MVTVVELYFGETYFQQRLVCSSHHCCLSQCRVFAGAYYAMDHEHLRIVVLNTNLYYYTNELTAAMPDPANQLQWLDDILNDVRDEGKKVHVSLINTMSVESDA